MISTLIYIYIEKQEFNIPQNVKPIQLTISETKGKKNSKTVDD